MSPTWVENCPTSLDELASLYVLDKNRWRKLQCICHWLHLAIRKREKLYVRGTTRGRETKWVLHRLSLSVGG